LENAVGLKIISSISVSTQVVETLDTLLTVGLGFRMGDFELVERASASSFFELDAALDEEGLL